MLPGDLQLRRDQEGDWGDLDAYDSEPNELALVAAEQLLSVYRSIAGVRFYVITERDRSVTTILLPEEY